MKTTTTTKSISTTATRFLLVGAMLTFGPAAFGQGAPGECASGFCGTPDMSGGGGGGGGGGSILIANTDLGETYSTSDDFDQDGYEDDLDNCPFVANTGQIDRDGDAVGDVCDNAPNTPNTDQLDTDGDGVGDVADDDIDGDAFANADDNCRRIPNPTQIDTNSDGEGDACDADDDGDGIFDVDDECPKIAGQVDPSTAGCRGDEDLDNITDAFDNCPGVFNADQADVDGDGLGDRCDVDIDDDGVLNNLDNAPRIANADQLDSDRDGVGDVADPEFCYVYNRAAPESCLDPLDTFKIGFDAIGVAGQKVTVGDVARLTLYANRINVPIEFSFVVSGRPSGSRAVIDNARGKVVSSDGYQYNYQKSGFVSPTFAPDAQGMYELRVEARLVFDDEAFPGGPQVATHTFNLSVEGDGDAGGCAALPSGDLSLPTAFFMVLGAVLVGRRKRR